MVTLNTSSLPRPRKQSRETGEDTPVEREEEQEICDIENLEEEEEEEVEVDLTVRSAAAPQPPSAAAVLSEAGGVDFLQSRVAEFCINI